MGVIEKTATRREELRIGDLVEVRSEAEILSTLDEHGMLESLPFMSEMLPMCGQRFRVNKLAHKACDTIDWTGLHRMTDAVHLADVRCDGSGHGGCQAGCLIYWKTSWLRKVDAQSPSPTPGDPAQVEPSVSGEPSRSARARLLAAGRRENLAEPGGRELFVCQATELMRAAPEVIPPWELRQYVDDVRTGNAGLPKVLRAVLVGIFNSYQRLSGRLLPAFLRIRGGTRYPFVLGRLTSTPVATLGLLPGELVRVRTKDQIVATLDTNNRNRGLSFDVEMLKYCGRTARVHRRVDQIIDEKTGEMIRMRVPCIILQDVTCAADFHRCCPRAVYAYWREAWLERVAPT
ncbi:MAG: hypothetical protein ABI807_05360 [Sporichthyaceae bacterium]